MLGWTVIVSISLWHESKINGVAASSISNPFRSKSGAHSSSRPLLTVVVKMKLTQPILRHVVNGLCCKTYTYMPATVLFYSVDLVHSHQS